MFTYDDFNLMLNRFNEKLMSNNLNTIIYAIGGFAMMCNAKELGFDSRGISIDIDSYYEYSEEIKKLVDEVSDEFGIISESWLNSHWYEQKLKNEGFDETIESYPFWKWEQSSDLTFSNLKVYYANLEGLLRMKLTISYIKQLH